VTNVVALSVADVTRVQSLLCRTEYVHILALFAHTKLLNKLQIPKKKKKNCAQICSKHENKDRLGMEVNAVKHHPSIFPYFNQQDALIKVQQNI
jgi:hypothetical protein